AEYSKVLGMLDRQMEEVVSNGNFYRQRMEQLKIEPPDLVTASQRKEELEQSLQSGSAEVGRLATQVQERSVVAGEEARLADRVTTLQAELAQLPSAEDEQRYAEVQRRIKALEPLVLEATRFKALADQGPAVKAELTAIKATQDSAGARVIALQAE